mgnify:CR=1 FL=1
MYKLRFLLPVLFVLLAACVAEVAPGDIGKAEAEIPSLIMKTYPSSQIAADFLNSFTTWEAEAEGVEVGRPVFTIVEHITNGAYINSTIEASVPYKVLEGAEEGLHTIRVVFYNADKSDSLEIIASLNVKTK